MSLLTVCMTCKVRYKYGRGSYSKYGRIVRILLETDRRVFTPIPCRSCVWEKDYRRRSAVERVNSRIDDGYRFEKHSIRRQQKMELRFGLALVVMLAMALGHIKTGKKCAPWFNPKLPDFS